MSDTRKSAIEPLVRAHGVKQIALVVRDLEASVRAYWELLNIGPWTSYTLGPDILKDTYYMGEPADFKFRHALAWKDDVQFELVEPIAGPSIFADHLQRHGEGLHHVGIFVPDQPKAMAELEAEGYRCVQKARGFGAEGDGAFAYFETDHPLATIIEVIGVPRIRRPATFIYPPENA